VKKVIELADTTFRAYKKKNGAIALHLRSHLIVYAGADFRAEIRNARPSLDEPMKRFGLSAFLKGPPRCLLQLPGKKERECEFFYGLFPETCSIERPTEGIWVTYDYEDIADEECTLFFFMAQLTIGDKQIEKLSIANMKLIFQINFPGRAANEEIIIRRKIPIVRRGHGW
jgi:hypothetical protein